MEDIIRSKYLSLKSEFNERQRRLWAAAEALSLGHGGISIVSRATGMSRTTIRKGINELNNKELLAPNRIRREGGGRKKSTTLQPKLLESLDALVEPTAKGDPMTPLRWTTKSTRRLSEILTKQGFQVSHMQVYRLLEELGYQLVANRKTLCTCNDPDRNTQFEFINAQSTKFMKKGCPVLSIDAKKKELIGNFKQDGRTWCPQGKPTLVQVYNFPSGSLGKATPYGVYDLRHNIGWVNVGIDHDTAEFAVESLRRWWLHLGQDLYPDTKDLYLTADGGGSNNSRSRLWKYCLQELADETDLTIHVSHFPPGTSKWNKIEHRLFNHISMNGKGQPLTSLDVIINLIGSTTSSTGLKVYAMKDDSKYMTKRKISDEQMNMLKIISNKILAKWNYTIKPRKIKNR